MADLARHVHVREELHLDLDRAVARAGLAAAALDVEGEAAWLVAPDLRLRGRGEQLPDVVEHAGVGRRVGARGTADRALVDVHDLVQVLHAGDPHVLAWDRARAVQFLHERPVEDVVDQGGLTRAADAGDRDEAAEREADVDVPEVVLLRALDGQLAALGRDAALVRYLDRLAAGQVRAGHGRLALDQLVDRAADDDVAAVLARAGADVDDPVGGADRVLVVFDNDERVTEVPQPEQGVQELLVVALVQADARLVEHVEHADQARADLGGEPDPLRLPACQGRGGTVQRQVVEAHVEEEAKAGVDLLEYEPGDRHVTLGQFQVQQVLRELADRLGAVRGDRLVVDRDREGDRLEARALAGRAGDLAHEAREFLPA